MDKVELQRAEPSFDAGVFIAVSDEAVPAHLVAMGRLNLPSVFVAGSMSERGAGVGAAMGTACTMRVIAEVLGLMLPGTALLPTCEEELAKIAGQAGIHAARLSELKLRPRDMVTQKSFENAVMVHAAISGPAEAVCHIQAIAREFGMEISAEEVDYLQRDIHPILDVQPAGRWPFAYFHLAGGVSWVMEEMRGILNLDELTVTGNTIRENLEQLRQSGYFKEGKQKLLNLGLQRKDVIRSYDAEVRPDAT